MRSKVLYGLILLILCGSFSKSRAQGTEEVSSKGTDFWIASTYPFYSNDSFLIAVSSSKPTRAYMSIPGFNIYDSLELGYNEIKYFANALKENAHIKRGSIDEAIKTMTLIEAIYKADPIWKEKYYS